MADLILTNIQEGIRTCTFCHITKPISGFDADRRTKRDGRKAQCRDCLREYSRGYHRKKKHIHRYLSRIRQRFGVTREQYFAALERCRAVCECCGQPQSSGKRLAVDHDHKTKAFRGLLCDHCNRAIGYLKEDLRRVDAVKRYILARCVNPMGISRRSPARAEATAIQLNLL